VKAKPAITNSTQAAMPKRPAKFTENDLARIFKAANKARIGVCIKIALDGSITIATVSSHETEYNPDNPWDEVLNGSAEQKRTA
jgi:hypothetical protein